MCTANLIMKNTRADDAKLTVSLVHGAFNCDQVRIKKGCEFGGQLSRYMANLCAAYILHRNGISRHNK